MHPQVLLAYGSPVAAALPRRWVEAMAMAAGAVGLRVLPGARAAVAANLQLALGAPVPDAVCRRVFRSYALYYATLMRLARLPLERAVGRVRVDGDAELEATLRRGRGALVLGAHLGNWDVAGAAFARRFGGLTTYAEPLQPPRLQAFYNDLRTRLGMRVVLLGSHDRAAVETLRRNGVVGLLVDRAYGENSVRVPFGRGHLDVPMAGIRLALRAGAGIHPFFPLRESGGYCVAIGADLAPANAGADEDDRVRRVAAAFATTLCRVVRRHPEAWYVLQRLPDARRLLPRAAPAVPGRGQAHAGEHA